MGVCQFHRVSGEFFRIEQEIHNVILAYLKANADTCQVMPFSDAMRVMRKK